MSQFQLTRLTEYSEKALLREIQRVAALVPDGTITRRAFDKVAHVSGATVQRHFGSWKAALEAAGLSGRYSGGQVTARMKLQTTKYLTNAALLDEMKRVAKVAGSAQLTQDIFRNHSAIHPTTICRRFGSWRRALRDAGLASSPLAKRYSDDERFDNLLKLWTHYGRAPVGREAELSPSTVGKKAYLVRWGTWRRALRAFVDRANDPVERPRDALNNSSAHPTVGSDSLRPKTNRRASLDPRAIPWSVRYRVLVRDKFRCVICGSSPAAQLGCVLHIDHLMPVSAGGTAWIENLRTLCDRCNLGKGSKIESDAV